MPSSEKTVHAKRLGNKALALVRSGKFIGNVDVNGRVKRIQEFERGRLLIRYSFPLNVDGSRTVAKSSSPTERGIEVVFDAVKVLRIAWDKQRAVVLTYKPGTWELVLRLD